MEVALDRWDTKQAGYIQKFGQELLQDREFNLLRLQVWKRIVKQHRKLNLSEGEFYDLQFVKGQIRQMNAALFPGIKGFFQKLNYTIARTIDRIFNGKPVLLKDAGMLTVTAKPDQDGNANRQSEKNGLTAVYVAPGLKEEKQLPIPQPEDVVAPTPVAATTPAPQSEDVVAPTPVAVAIPAPQPEEVAAQTPVVVAIPAPQSEDIVVQTPEISSQSPKEMTTERTTLQERKSFQRNNEIKTLTGGMRTLR